jgi:hypothetical protein
MKLSEKSIATADGVLSVTARSDCWQNLRHEKSANHPVVDIGARARYISPAVYVSR